MQSAPKCDMLKNCVETRKIQHNIIAYTLSETSKQNQSFQAVFFSEAMSYKKLHHFTQDTGFKGTVCLLSRRHKIIGLFDE